MKLKWAQDFYWHTWRFTRTKRMVRVWHKAGLCFGPGLTLPFGFAIVRFKPPFKDEAKENYIRARARASKRRGK